MKRIAPILLAIILALSLAAPSGAVFAFEGDFEIKQPDQSAVIEPQEDSVEESELSEVPDDEVISEEEDTEESDALLETPDVTESPEAIALPDILIAQIQVGATGNSSDEYISIYNNGDQAVDITGWCLRNKSSKDFVCLNQAEADYEISPGAYAGFSSLLPRVGEHGLLIGFSGSNKIVASTDHIQLVNGEKEVVDGISWTSQPAGSYAIERNWDLERPNHLDSREAAWLWKSSLKIYGRVLAVIECGDNVFVFEDEVCPVEEATNQCEGLKLSEIAANVSSQFIELQNVLDNEIDISGCQLQTKRPGKVFIFPENSQILAGDFLLVPINITELTLAKTTNGVVYVLSSDGKIEVDSATYSDLAKDTSFAKFGSEWKQTYTITPNSENIYTSYPNCDPGYFRNLESGRCNKIIEEIPLVDCGEGRERNPDTGRCRNVVVVQQLVPCKDGQYRSEETNRCRSIVSVAAAVLKPCDDDQFRNPLTNRCKKIASADDIALADCGEGRERNPTTNRCRNIVSAVLSSNSKQAFPVKEVSQDATEFSGWLMLGAIGLLGAGYAIFEWHQEIIDFGRKRFKSK